MVMVLAHQGTIWIPLAITSVLRYPDWAHPNSVKSRPLPRMDRSNVPEATDLRDSFLRNLLPGEGSPLKLKFQAMKGSKATD